MMVVQACLAATLLSATMAQSPSEEVEGRPVQVLRDGYVSSGQCRSCHPQNHATWHASYHRTMTQVASPEAIVAPFDNVELYLYGQAYRLSREGQQFWVEMPYPPGPTAQNPGRVKRRIMLTTGSHHFQMFWFASGQTRKLELFPFVYSVEGKRWFPEKSTFLMPPTQHVSTEPGRWNQACLQCHVTSGRPRVGTQDDMNTDVAEFGIACEACHGPGQKHVETMNRPGSAEEHRQGHLDLAIVNPKKLPHRRASQVCGQCHGISTFQSREELVRWIHGGPSFRPGNDLTASRFLIRFNQDRDTPQMQDYLKAQPWFLEFVFWNDGMVRTAGREFSALIESACYERGQMSCFSCHRMHKAESDPRPLRTWANDQLEVGRDNNEACLQCHTSYRTAPDKHSHHLASSSGSQCYNCHMPFTTYGLMKAIRSHQISSPNVASSLETGRPNACNQCHLNRSLKWAADHLKEWYGISSPKLSEEQETIAASVLWTLKGDAGQRALMAWTLGWQPAQDASGSRWIPPFLSQLLEDPYDAVRMIAYRSLRGLPHFENFDYDFVSSPSTRAAARKQAMLIWRRAYERKPSSNLQAVLLDANGSLRWEVFDRLLKQRDDRRLGLAE